MIEAIIFATVEYFLNNGSVVDTAFTLSAWGILLFAGIALYVLLVTAVLPYFLLSPSMRPKKTGDRGIKKYVFPEGRGVVYEPALRYRKHINRYMLFEYKGNKYLKLKLDSGVISAECEVALYNNRGKVVKVISGVFGNKNGESEAVIIPRETSYAAMTLIGVNGVKLSDTPSAEISVVRLSVFAAITTVLTVAMGAFIRAALVFVSELVFTYSKYGQPDGFGITLILSAVIGLLISLVGARLYSLKKRGR